MQGTVNQLGSTLSPRDADWKAIVTTCAVGEVNLAALAEKHSVSDNSIRIFVRIAGAPPQ